VQNDEMPKSLDPKVWWLLIGANDLVRGQCSEEAVIVGILRLADEIAMKRPGSIVVIQGILPRSSFADGALSPSHTKSKSGQYRPHRKEYFKTEHYPLWPSIKVINAELERFCEKHEHMVYFDASRLFFGNLGNEYFQSSDSTLLKELYMSDFAHPSVQGYRILAKVMGKELNRIIYDNDEDNHKATANEERL
jgi:lysophospholipase L1-like esterase